MISTLLAAVLFLQSPTTAPTTPPPPPTESAPATEAATPTPNTLTAPRLYTPPGQPLLVTNATDAPVDIMLVDLIGRSTSVRAANVPPGDFDVKRPFVESFQDGGCYLLAAVKPGGLATEFIGTPLVLTVCRDARRGAASGPLVYTLQPLKYAQISTTAGDMTLCFYYDTAPNTTSAIQRLIDGGFYAGLEFFRIEPGFIVQTGDPRNDGTGGPGFTLNAEFSDRQHLEGVVSLARSTDPNEAPGLAPRPEYANSGGSQFFISLSYDTTRQLDRRYTAFGRIVGGLDVLRKLAAAPLLENTVRPREPLTIKSITLVPVTRTDNPYATLRVVDAFSANTTQPAAYTAPTPPATQPTVP